MKGWVLAAAAAKGATMGNVLHRAVLRRGCQVRWLLCQKLRNLELHTSELGTDVLLLQPQKCISKATAAGETNRKEKREDAAKAVRGGQSVNRRRQK